MLLGIFALVSCNTNRSGGGSGDNGGGGEIVDPLPGTSPIRDAVVFDSLTGTYEGHQALFAISEKGIFALDISQKTPVWNETALTLPGDLASAKMLDAFTVNENWAEGSQTYLFFNLAGKLQATLLNNKGEFSATIDLSGIDQKLEDFRILNRTNTRKENPVLIAGKSSKTEYLTKKWFMS